MINESKDMIMNFCHCSRNTFTIINGTALCLNCHTDFQNVTNNNVNSAYQLHRGIDVANNILKARVDLQRNQTVHQIKNERNTEVNNYNTHNNITVQGNNSGTLQAGKTLIQSNDIGIANLSKSGNGIIGWLAKIIANGLQKFFIWLIGFFR